MALNASLETRRMMGRISLPSLAAFDRLSLLNLVSSLYFFQFWAFASFGTPEPGLLTALRIALIAMCCTGIVLPHLRSILIINAAACAIYYLATSPIASNNQLTAFAASLTVLGATLAVLLNRTRQDPAEARETLFETIAGPGRWLLAVMYFYGIYHKLNADFLNPQVSCASALYDTLAMPFGMDGWSVGHYGAIATTFIVEGIAMIALFTPRWKRWGMLIGIPFHIIIGWTGYAYYKDFSTIVLFLYALFLPREALLAAIQSAASVFGSKQRAARIAVIALAGGLLTYLIATGSLFSIDRIAPTHQGFFLVFTVYAIAFYAFIVKFMPAASNEPQLPLIARPAWLMAMPALFFLNGLSPYLGLKTESSIAMYSNLHTEGGGTNHLLHGQLPFAANYQNDLVTPITSNSATFNQRYVGEGKALIRFDFDRMLATQPDLIVTFLHNGVTHTSDPTWTNTWLAASPLERRFLTFKPVDANSPKVCTH